MNKKLDELIDLFEENFADEAYVKALFEKTLEEDDSVVGKNDKPRKVKSKKIHPSRRHDVDKRSDDALIRNMVWGVE